MSDEIPTPVQLLERCRHGYYDDGHDARAAALELIEGLCDAKEDEK